MSTFLTKVKEYYQWAVAGLVAILGIAFLVERTKNKANEALVNNNAALKEIDKLDAQKDVNNAQLQTEEQKREEIAKEAEHAESTPTDPADFFNQRK